MKTYIYGLSAAALIGIFGGCSSTPPVQVSQIPADANPQEQVAQFEAELNNAKANRQDWLSPTHFKSAQEELASAKSILHEQGKNTEIFKHVGLGRAELAAADKYAKTAQASIPSAITAYDEAMSARAEAEKAGAKDLNASFEEADGYFVKLTKAIEDNDTNWATDHQAQAIKYYRAAGGDANKKRYLDAAKQTLDLAKKEDAKSYAPTAFKQAMESYEATEKFSDNNPYATDQIVKRGETTLALAKRALNLTRESLMLDRWTPEQRVSWVEKSLGRIGKNLNVADMSDQPFEKQVATIERSLGSVKNLASTAKGAQEQNAQLRMKEGLLQSSVAWNQKFESVSKQFSPKEAEVLRDGDRLIIRLKDIHFPVGGAQIQQQDYTLLTKLQKAIGEFDNSKVIVEGHTDSTGSAAINQKLSEARASAVKDYLVANESVSPDEIEAVGRGFSKPLADNKTKSGRALNRRIDLVIEPAQASATTTDQETTEDPASAE